MTKNREYDKFDRTMQELVRIPHDKIKAKLEAEKKEKAEKAKGKKGK